MKAKRRIPLALAAVLVTAAGCENPYKKDLDWTEESVLKRGWIAQRHIHVRSIYCYRTLAEQECYSEPLEGEQARLIGYFGRAPE